jgi:hypothetical protein
MSIENDDIIEPDWDAFFAQAERMLAKLNHIERSLSGTLATFDPPPIIVMEKP